MRAACFRKQCFESEQLFFGVLQVTSVSAVGKARIQATFAAVGTSLKHDRCGSVDMDPLVKSSRPGIKRACTAAGLAMWNISFFLI